MRRVLLSHVFKPSIYFAVDDRPEEKFLNRYAREQLCAMEPQIWKDLGLELLGKESNNALGVIENNHSDVTIRCSNMFELWLRKQPTASWRKLIQAMKQLKLNSLADQIESQLIGPLVEPIPGLFVFNK